MRKTRLPIRLLTAAMATGLMLSTTAALAQSAASRAEERRASRANKGGDAAKAEKRYPEASRQEPTAKASPKMTSKLQALFKAYEADDVAKAQPIADEIMADEKANEYDKAMAARLIGSMLLGGDNRAGAIGYLQRALEFNGLDNNDHYEVMFIIAQLQAQDDKYAEALTTLDRLLTETKSQDPNQLVLKGNILLRLERYPEAIAVLKPLIDATAEPDPQWLQLLMAAYAESGQADEAARLAEQVAAKTPGDKRSQLNLAATYLQSEQYDKAAVVYEKLRAAGELTEDRDYRNLMALYINSDNGNQKAIDVINEGLGKGILTADAKVYVALAQAYYFSEPSRVEEAIAAYRKAAPLDERGESALNLAKVLANEGRLPEAKQAAQQALDKGIRAPDEAKRILARTN